MKKKEKLINRSVGFKPTIYKKLENIADNKKWNGSQTINYIIDK